jgi:hypothetical protein
MQGRDVATLKGPCDFALRSKMSTSNFEQRRGIRNLESTSETLRQREMRREAVSRCGYFLLCSALFIDVYA